MIRHIKLPDPPDTRRPMNDDDWGDVLTIGLHLKNRDSKEGRFGVYMGLNKVGVKALTFELNIISTIQYNSEEEMKKEWILD